MECYRPNNGTEPTPVINSNRRGGLRAFWLAHAHLFAPAFGSIDVARGFLDSLVYRDELSHKKGPGFGITVVETYFEGLYGSPPRTKISEVLLTDPAKAIEVVNAPSTGNTPTIGAGDSGQGTPKFWGQLI